MTPVPLRGPYLLCSCFVFFLRSFDFEHCKISPHLMNKFSIFCDNQFVITGISIGQTTKIISRSGIHDCLGENSEIRRRTKCFWSTVLWIFGNNIGSGIAYANIPLQLDHRISMLDDLGIENKGLIVFVFLVANRSMFGVE